MIKQFKKYFPAIVISVLFLFAWESYVRLGFIAPSFLPAPSAIFQALFDYKEIIWAHTLQTLLETLIGLGLSVGLGIAVGIIIFSSDTIRKAVYPLLVLSQTIPIIALAPLLLIWFGFDLFPKVLIIVLYCFFPIAVAVSDGLTFADRHLIDLMKSMKASRWQTLRYVEIPSALPSFFSGLRISTTYAITGAIVGEYVGAYQGLGIYMQQAAHSHAIVLVFASLFVVIFLTLTLLSFVAIAEKLLIPWRNK